MRRGCFARGKVRVRDVEMLHAKRLSLVRYSYLNAEARYGLPKVPYVRCLGFLGAPPVPSFPASPYPQGYLRYMYLVPCP